MWVLWVLLVVVAFYLGAYLGIKDCKKQFGIPKGVSPDFIKRFNENESVILTNQEFSNAEDEVDE